MNIRFAIAQMNPTVGDLSGNSKKIISWIEQAEAHQADLIVFPEVALSGYPIWDLANRPDFVQEGLRQLDGIVRTTRGKKISALVGFVDRGTSPDGRSRNACAWITNGKIARKYSKQLLPTYDVFLEDVFFEAGRCPVILPWKGRRFGLTICEDIWDQRYEKKPLRELRRKRADTIINLSASPFYAGVDEARDRLLKGHAKRYGFPFLYVNQVGAQDDLIFDGQSVFVDGTGKVLFRAPAFQEGLFYYDWDPRAKRTVPVSLSPRSERIKEMYDALVLGIRDYCRKNGFKKVVIGLSGGIDSSLVATLAVDALGPEAVMGIAMPSHYSSKGSWEDAEDLARRLGIEFHIHPIRDAYASLSNIYREQLQEDGCPPQPEGKITLAMENLQARLRGLHLMYLSNDQGRLLLSTGNKSELAMGYCTLYGDMAGGLCVLGDVYKTDVYRLSRYRNQLGEVIPESSLTKPPSAELRPNQKDQDSLPAYEILDEILIRSIERNEPMKKICSTLGKLGVAPSVVAETVRKVDHNEYKRRQSPPILRVTQKAWFGRRMPITNRFMN